MRTAGIAGHGRNVAVYLDDVMNIEVGDEVSGMFTDDGKVVPSTTPAGTAVRALHVGPHDRLAEAYSAIHDWCGKNQRKPAGIY